MVVITIFSTINRNNMVLAKRALEMLSQNYTFSSVFLLKLFENKFFSSLYLLALSEIKRVWV